MARRRAETSAVRAHALGTEVLTTSEAAHDCNVSVRTIYRAIKSGKLKAYRLNKDFRIKRDDIRAWWEGLVVTEEERAETKV